MLYTKIYKKRYLKRSPDLNLQAASPLCLLCCWIEIRSIDSLISFISGWFWDEDGFFLAYRFCVWDKDEL